MRSLKINTDNIIKSIASLELTKRGMVSFLHQYESKFLGSETIEFFDYREYTPQDTPKTIDWKASIRRGELIVKETLIEREAEIIIVVDCGANMLYGSINKLKLEYALEIALGLSYLALMMGLNVGAVLYDDIIRGAVKPGSGMIQFDKIKHTLLKPTVFGHKSDINKTIPIIHSMVKRESVVIFLSDFINFNESNKKTIELLALQCRVKGVMIRDILDKKVPKGGHVWFKHPETNETILIDTHRIAAEYESTASQQEIKVTKDFMNSNADIKKLYTNVDLLQNFRRLIYEKNVNV